MRLSHKVCIGSRPSDSSTLSVPERAADSVGDAWGSLYYRPLGSVVRGGSSCSRPSILLRRKKKPATEHVLLRCTIQRYTSRHLPTLTSSHRLHRRSFTEYLFCLITA